MQGNAYRGRAEQPEPGAISVTGTSLVLGQVSTSGVNLSGQWTRALDGGASLMLQAYADRSKRTVIPTYAESLAILDLQFQHTLAPMGGHGKHRVVWGANLRHTWDDVTNSAIVAFLPPKLQQDWASLFAQDEVALAEHLRLTAGVRLERNDYTGVEVLPTLRLAWQAAPSHAFWGALSRTVRAPSRLDADTFIPGRPPYVLRGGPAIRSETARVLELGYRGQPLPRLAYSVTAFHNRYDDFRTTEVDPGMTFLTFGNQMEGKARGLEMWGNFQASPAWRLSAGLMLLRQRLWLKPGSLDTGAPLANGRDPRHTAQLRSAFALADNLEFDVAVRRVGELADHKVPAYTALDARLGWRPRPGLEVAIHGQNLNGGHAEYGPLATRAMLGRSLGFRLVWQN